MSKESNRKKAEEFGAVDAGALIATVPCLARLLSTKEIGQIQTVLDAAVLNPMYREQYNKSIKDSSFRSHDGTKMVIDETKQRRALKIYHNRKIRVPKNAKFIRVDHRKMLTADALTPRTNNPDEAKFLTRVRQVLNSKGVWLVLNQPWNRGKANDPRVWEFSFSLGPSGIPIDTDDAMIDRDELFGPTMLGQGYLRAVLTGPVRIKLRQLHKRLERQLESGRSAHGDVRKMRESTNRHIVKASDRWGSANFPDMSIWDRPHKLNMKAYDANTAGDVLLARAYIVFAAQQIEYNALLLADYTGKTIKGTETVVKILKVAKFAGEVAEIGLSLVGIRTTYLKFVQVGGAKMLRGKAKDMAIDRLAEEYAKELGMKEELKLVKHAKKLGSPDK